ncbi:MAG: orotate phosphoribosyltransferase [Clostridiales bacterium]|nr:orotate phosphoribosyltransferase [Clostridiales bacterium]
MGYKESFIDFMTASGVLTFGDFITKSGRRTPYFINTGSYRTGAQVSSLGDFYADCIQESKENFDVLFGPAYKGIPLAVSTSISLWRKYGRDIPYSFNRKEIKDHGEGGAIVGQQLCDGMRVAIIEDVVTAGTAVRETLALMRIFAKVDVTALYVSVDRMERGSGVLSALDELQKTLGIKVYPIVTVREIISYLSDSGRLGAEQAARMESYLAEFGADNG